MTFCHTLLILSLWSYQEWLVKRLNTNFRFYDEGTSDFCHLLDCVQEYG